MDTSTGKFNYGEALQKSFLFYEAQRSGDLPANNRIDWRGDSTLDDGETVGLDLGGGYFEAGNYIKFNYPLAASMTVMAWGIDEFKDAYSQSGQLDEALDAIKWGTDYLLKSHVTENGETVALWGQVGEPDIEHDLWQPIEQQDLERPAFKIDKDNPGSDLAGEVAASLASASIIFQSSDPEYAEELLENAISLYDFAEQYQGKYSDSITSAQGTYTSSGYQDELGWGAMWLYKATGDSKYLEKADFYSRYMYLGDYTQIWDDKTYGTKVLLAQEFPELQNEVENWLDKWVNGTNGVEYTEGGLAWRGEWGSLRLSANTAFLAAVYAENVNDKNGTYSDFVEQQIDYMLGDNPRNSSYVIGFGENFPKNPHHRGSHGGSWETFGDEFGDNENILYGALVGGPTSVDDLDYNDSRSDWFANEATLDYNAMFVGALAYMYDNFGGEPLSDRELNNLEGITVTGGSRRNNSPQVVEETPEVVEETPEVVEETPEVVEETPEVVKETPEESSGEEPKVMFGGTEGETIELFGNNTTETVYAGDGDDTIFLGRGNNVYGVNGNDRFFVGRGGNNKIVGNMGNDEFWIANGEIPRSPNTITDFTSGEDVIGIDGLGIGYDDLTFTQSNLGAVISFEGQDLAIFSNANSDFIANPEHFVFT